MFVIENYYHMITMNDNVNWMKLTYLLLIFSLNHMAPFCTSNFTSIFIIAFSNIHITENNTSPLCTLCTLVSQIISLLTLMLVCTWYEESTPGDLDK